jgi:GAF domain-containing protein
VAVPLFLRGELGGIAVYVDRIDDAPLDEEELHYFERLAGAAAAALDHADAVESRKLRAIGLAESQTLGFGTAGAAPAAAAVPGAVPDTLGGAGSVDIAAPVEREDAVAAVGERLEPVREPAGHVLAIYQQPGMIAPLPD